MRREITPRHTETTGGEIIRIVEVIHLLCIDKWHLNVEDTIVVYAAVMYEGNIISAHTTGIISLANSHVRGSCLNAASQM